MIAVCSDASGRMARGTWAWVRENGTYAYGQSATPSDVGSTELRAAIEAVRATPEGSEVHLRTDSRVTLTLIAPYAIITGFDLGGPTKFRPELVDEFAELAESREIIAHWVRGHRATPEPCRRPPREPRRRPPREPRRRRGTHRLRLRGAPGAQEVPQARRKRRQEGPGPRMRVRARHCRGASPQPPPGARGDRSLVGARAYRADRLVSNLLH
ncbi:RNase H family protein [Frondihabitans sucicola]|uniref:RNase H family protein n=1 Tax=Frondihabitans sucicola TaxID=1268041 RepID=UPI003305D685